MKVSETVRTLAKNVAASRNDLSARHRVLLELLQLMPLYSEARRLDAWEQAMLAALPRIPRETDASEVGRLLEEIIEFGRFNLYGSFDPGGTKESYTKLSKLLQSAGIDYPEAERFTGF